MRRPSWPRQPPSPRLSPRPASGAIERLRTAGVEPVVREGFGSLRAAEARRGALPDGSELMNSGGGIRTRPWGQTAGRSPAPS